jgi:hypothetical protein
VPGGVGVGAGGRSHSPARLRPTRAGLAPAAPQPRYRGGRQVQPRQVGTASSAGRSRPGNAAGVRADGSSASARVNGPMRGPHQHLDQPAAAQRLAHVPGDRPDVRPASAGDLQLQEGPGVAQQLDPVDRDRARGQLDLAAGRGPGRRRAGRRLSARRIGGAPGGSSRPGRPGPSGLGLGRHRRGGDLDDPAVGVQRVAPRAEADDSAVGLRLALDVFDQPGGRADADDEDPEARGSSVPACPTLVPRSGRETRSTASREVRPVGLFRFSTPQGGRGRSAASGCLSLARPGAFRAGCRRGPGRVARQDTARWPRVPRPWTGAVTSPYNGRARRVKPCDRISPAGGEDRPQAGFGQIDRPKQESAPKGPHPLPEGEGKMRVGSRGRRRGPPPPA